jgi:drug/metabolite transporter (DMT)-like permease
MKTFRAPAPVADLGTISPNNPLDDHWTPIAWWRPVPAASVKRTESIRERNFVRISQKIVALGLAAGFASAQGGNLGRLHWSDLLLFGAVLSAAIGYAEGGLLARELGAWQTVSWALVVCAPLMLTLAVLSAVRQAPQATPVQWAAFAYLAVVSMFLGFFAWYHGLAVGPMAQVSQVQLVQPVLTITWAGLLLREHLSAATLVGGLVVVLCAAGAVRVRLGGR